MNNQESKLFVAINLPEELSRSICLWREQITPTSNGWNWEQPEKYHVTLKYLGLVKEEFIADVIRTLDAVASEGESFALEIYGTGVFPSVDSPRVLWLGLNEGFQATQIIASNIDRRLADLGFMKDHREFVPHVTIGRAEEAVSTDILRSLLNATKAKSFGRFAINQLSVMKSCPVAKGSRYELVHASKIGQSL